MRAAAATLRWVNVGLANLLIVAHAGLLAYLAAAWSLAGLLGPTATTLHWVLLALGALVLAVIFGALLGCLVWVLNGYALRGLGAAARQRWSRRLGAAAFWVVVLGGCVGAVELLAYRPSPPSHALSLAVVR
jgi:heme/copper-type cytochrome/quinol oxidase subunit 2